VVQSTGFKVDEKAQDVTIHPKKEAPLTGGAPSVENSKNTLVAEGQQGKPRERMLADLGLSAMVWMWQGHHRAFAEPLIRNHSSELAPCTPTQGLFLASKTLGLYPEPSVQRRSGGRFRRRKAESRHLRGG
jgi:hypothetical protein